MIQRVMRMVRKRLFSLKIRDYAADSVAMGIHPGDERASNRMDQIVRTVFAGNDAALHDPGARALASRLAEFEDIELAGFHYEGAGMGLGLLDACDPLGRDRFGAFVESCRAGLHQRARRTLRGVHAGRAT